MMEALWVHQYHNVVNVDLLKRMLQSPDFRARAAATRVLCYWRDRVPDALELLKKLAADPYPRVRLEAVRAASFFTVPEAVEVALISTGYPSDNYARVRPRRDDEGARALLEEGDLRGPAHRLHQRRRRPVLPPGREHRRAPEDEADPGDRPGAALPQGRPRRGPPRGAGRPRPARQQERAERPDRRHPGARTPRGTPRTRASSSTSSACSPAATPPTWPASAAHSRGWPPARPCR